MPVPSVSQLLRSTVASVFTLLAGIGLVVLGVFVVATVAPGGARDLHAYEAAARCPAAPAASAGCRWTQEFTVSAVHLTAKRSDPYRAVLSGADGVRWETHYGNAGPVLDRLDVGDRVTGTVWRGRLTEIQADGDRQRAEDAPADMRTRVLILALIVVPSGLLMTVACGWRLLRRGRPTPGMAATLGLAFGLGLGGLFCPLLVGRRGEHFSAVAAAWLPLAVLLTVVARGYVIQKRAGPAPSR